MFPLMPEHQKLHGEHAYHPDSRACNPGNCIPQILAPVSGLSLNQLNHRSHSHRHNNHPSQKHQSLSHLPLRRSKSEINQRHKRQKHQKMHILVRKMQQLRLLLNELRVKFRKTKHPHRHSVKQDDNFKYNM